MAIDYMDMAANARYGSDYERPDWLRQNFGMGFSGYDADQVNSFFANNPQYAQDFRNITSGGRSAYSTDGSSLIKSRFDSMPSGVADHYSRNPNELLANEGFGFDPTLAYMNYYQGPASIGVNSKTTNVSDVLRNNRWTPTGMQGSNNMLNYARTPFGAGALQSAQQGGSTRLGTPSTGGIANFQAGPQTGTQTGASFTSTIQQNPYAQQMANTLGQQMGEQFQRQIAPQIASGAQLAGGYGGSRQGVLEANAANDLSQNTGQAIGTLLGNLYGQDLSYNLGMGNLGLGYANLDRNINNDNNQWGLQGAQLGMQLQDRQLQQNQLGLGYGTQIYNQPWNNLNQYGGLYNQIGQGFGSQTQSGGGNPLMGALGGAQLGSQLGGKLGGWWDSQSNNAQPYNPATANQMAASLNANGYWGG